MAKEKTKTPVKKKKKEKKYPGGKKDDWSTKGSSVNFCTGCSHGCTYCYSFSQGCQQKWATPETWTTMKVREHDVKRKRKNIPYQVMFPSSHDILPHIIDPYMSILQKLLDAGNKRILIVSKPHIECITAICKNFKQYRDRLVFRFTIGSTDDRILSLWEPFAPKYKERKECLTHAFNEGFTTSVSCEPMIDQNRHEELVCDLMPYINHSIWFGIISKKMYFIKKHQSPEFLTRLNQLYERQTENDVQALYDKFKSNPLVKLTRETREMIGIDEPPEFIL